MSDGSQPLLEREEEVRALRAELSAARAGSGGLIVFEGNAGKGKSRLLAEAAKLARDAGMAVLRARGDEAEREFAFGVALQLLEPPLHRADAAERVKLFAGAAELARPLLAARLPAGRGPRGFEFFSLAHGLYWVTHNLAETGPLVVLVDDLQWADVPSLRFLWYLGRRIGDLPIALVTARRVGEQPRGDAPFPPVEARPLRLKALSSTAVARLVRLRLPDASDAFCAACARATAGNPFLLEELLRTVVAEELPPTDEGAAEVRALAPGGVALRAAAPVPLCAPGREAGTCSGRAR